jgi:hypothetical protein
MRNAALARPRKSVAVTVLGLSTLLLGVAYAALGGWLIFAGADMLMHPSKDPWVQIITIGGFVPALVIALGVAFLPPGILGLLGGLGLILRQQWGRILTFIVAVVPILLGLIWVVGSNWDATDIAVGAVQLLYGILAFVILIMNGAEFSRPRMSVHPGTGIAHQKAADRFSLTR